MKQKMLTNFIDLGLVLGREGMKKIMAGFGGDGCLMKLTCGTTGCLPRFDIPGTCVGSDGCTYSYAKPC